MKSPHMAEWTNGSTQKEMKSQNAGPHFGAGRRSSPVRIPQIPMEWMDPMSWRLPSGKALAEFALQAGFLAPLLFGTPNFKKRKKMPPGAANRAEGLLGIDKQREGTPEHSGSFRESR